MGEFMGVTDRYVFPWNNCTLMDAVADFTYNIAMAADSAPTPQKKIPSFKYTKLPIEETPFKHHILPTYFYILYCMFSTRKSIK